MRIFCKKNVSQYCEIMYPLSKSRATIYSMNKAHAMIEPQMFGIIGELFQDFVEKAFPTIYKYDMEGCHSCNSYNAKSYWVAHWCLYLFQWSCTFADVDKTDVNCNGVRDGNIVWVRGRLRKCCGQYRILLICRPFLISNYYNRLFEMTEQVLTALNSKN